MKKRILAMLLAVLLIALCGCSEQRPNDDTQTLAPTMDLSGQFTVGYGRVNITPEESVPLAGAGNTSQRMSTGTLTYLYSTCIAITDTQGETVLLFSNDLLVAWTATFTSLRNAISEATGIPVDNIHLACTHTHNAPDLENSEKASAVRYKASLQKWVVKAAQLALADRRPATMYTGTTNTAGLNFTRHYVTESGAVKGDNFGDDIHSPITGHHHDVDSQLQLIKFVREDGKDIVMANWQTHPHRTSASATYDVSADLIDAMRERMERELDCNFIYFTGAAGNVNPTSRIAENNVTSNYLEQGRMLAKYALDAMPNLKQANTGDIKLTSTTYVATVDHTEDNKLAKAKEVANYWASTNDLAGANKMAQENEMNSPYHANGIISKANKPKTMDMKIYALSFGDVAFVFAPYEMFDVQGAYIKGNSPYDMTFISTCANEAFSYIPDEAGFDNNSYEANSSYFVRGTAEALAEEYVALLEQIHP